MISHLFFVVRVLLGVFFSLVLLYVVFRLASHAMFKSWWATRPPEPKIGEENE